MPLAEHHDPERNSDERVDDGHRPDHDFGGACGVRLLDQPRTHRIARDQPGHGHPEHVRVLPALPVQLDAGLHESSGQAIEERPSRRPGQAPETVWPSDPEGATDPRTDPDHERGPEDQREVDNRVGRRRP